MSQPRYSLPTQIAEVRREIDMRRGVYKHQRMKDGEMKIAIMESVLETLEWLYRNEVAIKAKVDAA